jgi:hypothetical protein
MTRAREHCKITFRIRVFVAGPIFFVPVPESIHIRDIFWAAMTHSFFYSRSTTGQSTSVLAIIQGSFSAAARHSVQAGSAMMACL